MSEIDPSPNPVRIGEVLFSLKGRIGRTTFLISYAFLVVLSLIGFGLDIAAGGEVFRFTALFRVATLWPELALLIKRLQDRNRSPWLSLIVLVVLIAYAAGRTLMLVESPFGPALLWLSLLLTSWLLIEVAILKGTTGSNRYGPDPVARQDHPTVVDGKQLLPEAVRCPKCRIGLRLNADERSSAEFSCAKCGEEVVVEG